MALFEIAQGQQHITDLVNKTLFIYTMEYYAAIKKEMEGNIN